MRVGEILGNVKFVLGVIGSWALNWTEEQKNIEYYNNILKLNDNELTIMRNEISQLYELNKFGMDYIFTDLEAAREIYKKYLKNINGVRLIGIGLKEDEYRIFKYEEQIEKDNKYYGVNICFNKKGYDIT